MGKWTTTTAGLVFLAASSVYSDRVIADTQEIEATGNGQTAPAVASIEPGDLPEAQAAQNPEPAVEAPVAESTEPTDPFGAPVFEAIPVESAVAPSSSEVNVTDLGTVEIHVNDANLIEVLRMLALQSQRNIVPSKDVRGTVTANLYDVTVREALDAILHANGFAYREKGNFIYVYTVRELAEIEKAERQMRTEVFRLYHTPAANAQNMIRPVLSSNGQVAMTTPTSSGIGSSKEDAGGFEHAVEDMLVVTDYPENLEQVKRILAEVDRRPQQILLEATILRASLTEENALGVDFNILGGVNFTDVVTSNGQFTNATIAPGTPLADRTHSVGTGNNFTSPIPGGFKVGVVSSNVSVFVSALEQVTDTTVLANPKVLALNRQRGEVIVGREDGYLTTVFSETVATQKVEQLQTGTRLIFRPFIAADGYIRMEVHPEDSDGEVGANGLPSKRTTEVTSNVMVKDGHTIVIGGLFREGSTIGKNQIPFLGNLPLAGALFRSQRDNTVREEIIILLTPHIVKDDAAFAALSEDEKRHMERLRVGVRRGMMPWGRERLAQASYETARAELAKPEPNRRRALWHLNCATNLNPKFTEAIELKEDLTGRVLSEADTSSVRTFVSGAILHDVVPAEPSAAMENFETTEEPVEATDLRADASETDESEAAETAQVEPSDMAEFEPFAGFEFEPVEDQTAADEAPFVIQEIASDSTTDHVQETGDEDANQERTTITELPLIEIVESLPEDDND